MSAAIDTRNPRGWGFIVDCLAELGRGEIARRERAQQRADEARREPNTAPHDDQAQQQDGGK